MIKKTINIILTLIQIRTTIYTGDKYNVKCIRSSLKKSKSNFDVLTKEVRKYNRTTRKEKQVTKTIGYKPELDKSGNGYAVIRFLPAIEGEDMPWQKESQPCVSRQVVNGILKTL